MKKDLSQIWNEILSDDKDSWKELVIRYQPLVMTVALRTGLSNSDAEDCSQHTWISLYKNRDRIADPLRLPSWLIKTTNRRAMRIIYNKKRDREILSE